jgi:CheY-like chemotaxis protein
MKNQEPFTILLVEDNIDHAEMVIRNLEDVPLAHTVVHLEDGEAALDYLYARDPFGHRRASALPHLMLLDLRLPKVSGLEVLAQVKGDAQLRALPVVILTTSDAETDVARAYASHANSYLTKPADFAEFGRMLQDTMAYWLNWNRQL